MVVAKLGTFSKLFFIVVACFFIINAIIIGIEEKNAMAGIVDIGNKLIYSTQQLSDASNEIYEQGYVMSASAGFIQIIKVYWNLISSLLSVLLWIRIFSWIVDSVLKLPGFFNFLVGLVLVILIQMIVLLIVSDGNKMEIALTPIICIWNFIRILPILIVPFRDAATRFIS